MKVKRILRYSDSIVTHSSNLLTVVLSGRLKLLSWKNESVLSELITHWEEHGRDAIDRTCKENPGAYMRAVLSVVPKDFALTEEKDETPQCIEIRFVD